MDCHFLLQGIFPTQESNPGSPALQADALPSAPPRKPNLHDKEGLHDACLLAFSNNKDIRENFFANRGNTRLVQPVLTFY